MNKNSKRTLLLLEMINEGWFVKDGRLYMPNGSKYEKLYISIEGYWTLTKHVKGNNDLKSNVGVHCIVAFQKFGSKIFDTPELKVHIRHLDGNKLNNLDSNIEIGSQSDNILDIPKEIRVRSAIIASSVNRRFSDEEVKLILKDRKNGFTYKMLCEKYNTSKSTLSFLFNFASYAK
jgi:hypothetical protein